MTRIVVVGDVLLDRDVVGTADRLCPDAPAPVVDEESVVERPGGAGLAAVLAARHGADVTLLGAFADDASGRRLRALLEEAGVGVVALRDSGSTCEKTRVRVDGRSLLRLDRGTRGRVGPLPASAVTAVRCADAVLVADYGRGVGAHATVRSLVRSASQEGLGVVWDPHPRGTPPPAGLTVVTPNRSEVLRLGGTDGSTRSLQAVAAAAEAVRTRWECDAVAVTLGPEGALTVRRTGPAQVVPVDRQVAGGDVCGAGDAFAAAATVALAAGLDLGAAVEQAVAAASRFVADGGASAMSELPQPEDFGEPAAGASRIDAIRAAGGTVVATGGCFDVLHPGHVSTLQRARGMGDCLVVLVNDDASVRRLKGPDRPVQRLEDRMAVLRSLGCVDEVVPFGEDTPVVALRRLRPDVFVKGGDYAAERLPEAEVLASWGGVVVTVPYLAGRSTTRILGRSERAMANSERGERHVG